MVDTKGSTKSKSSSNSKKLSISKKSSKETIKEKLPIGINDPFGLNINPLTNKSYQNLYQDELKTIKGEVLPATYANLSRIWTKLLVYQNKDIILEGISNNQVLLAKAGTGVGKTVIIPKLALHAFNYQEKVITTIPKKIITKSTADFAAKCMDVKLGEEVGYYYKGENMTNRNGKDSKLIFTTTGSLISRMTGNDPLLKDYKCVIIDEAHERSVQTDILLLLLKEALLKRPDLKVIIMSATIDLQIFRNYFPKQKFGFGEVDAGNVLSYPIQDIYLKEKPKDWIAESVKLIIKILKTSDKGDILVFGKSKGDGSKLCQLLEQEIKKIDKSQVNFNPFCISLASGVSNEDEKLATDEIAYLQLEDNKGNKYTRKVVVSTNVAESSLTVDGVEFVIDSGLQFTDGYYPEVKARSLLQETISKASATQRRGRCGRTKPGICYHMYSKNDFDKMRDYPVPDIQKTDLTSYFLDLLRLPYISNIGDLKKLLNKFISPPKQSFIEDGLNTLSTLGCITNKGNIGKLTTLGEVVSKFRGLKPEMGIALVNSYFYKCSNEVSKVIALMNLFDGQIESLFLPYQVNKRLTPQQEKQVKAKFDKYRKELTNGKDDISSLITLIKYYDEEKQRLGIPQEVVKSTSTPLEDVELSRKSIKEDLELDTNIITNSQNDNKVKELVLPSQKGIQRKLEKWCKERSINSKHMRRLNDVSKQIKRVLLDSMKMVKKNTKFIKDMDDKMLSNKLGLHILSHLDMEDKILFSIIFGYATHLARKVSGNTYQSCLALQKKDSVISPKSLMKQKSEYLVCDEFFMSNEKAPLKCNVNLSISKDKFEKVKARLDKIEIICPKPIKKKSLKGFKIKGKQTKKLQKKQQLQPKNKRKQLIRIKGKTRKLIKF